MITKPPAEIQTEHLEFWHAIGAIFLFLMWYLMAGSNALFAAMAVASSLCYFYAYGFPLNASRLVEFVFLHWIAIALVNKLDYPHLVAVYLYLTLPMNRFPYYPEYQGYSRWQEKMTNAWYSGLIAALTLNLIGESWLKEVPLTELLADEGFSMILTIIIFSILLLGSYGIDLNQKKTYMAWILGILLLVVYHDIVRQV